MGVSIHPGFQIVHGSDGYKAIPSHCHCGGMRIFSVHRYDFFGRVDDEFVTISPGQSAGAGNNKKSREDGQKNSPF